MTSFPKVLELSARIPSGFECKEGCAECCKNKITVLKVEWEESLKPLAEKLLPDDRTILLLHSGEDLERNFVQVLDPDRMCCPFLGDDMQTCLIYDDRPFVCRQYAQHWGMRCSEGVECPPEAEIEDEVLVEFGILMHDGTREEGAVALTADKLKARRRQLESWREQHSKRGDQVPQTLEELAQFHALS